MTFQGLSEIEDYRLGYCHAGSQLKDFVYARSRRLFAAGEARRDAVATVEALQERQAALREFVVRSLGGISPDDTPLNASVRGRVDADAFTVEAVVFEPRPRHYLTASLYLPRDRPARCPAVLFLCGHSAEGRFAQRYQSVCQLLARAGLIVLAQDPVGQGERSSYFDARRGIFLIPRAVRDHDQAGLQCRWVGDSLARYMLHDAMRGIDYLQSRPEVDPGKIGVTGNSGGGTQAALLMMADPRIAAAAPGTFLMSRESYQTTGQAQDSEQIWPGFTAAGYDHEDILLVVAPKPVCVLAVKSDFFPIEGTRRTVERARRFWRLHGCPERLEAVEDASTHGFTEPLARAAAHFFSRHLLGRPADEAALCAEPYPEARLWATAKGQVAEEFADAEFVFDANLGRVRESEARRAKLPPAERRARAVAWLKERVFAHREECDSNPRLIHPRAVFRDLECDVAFWWTQPGLANLGFLFRPAGGERRGVTLALWEGGSRSLTSHGGWLRRECARGRAVLVLNLSGMGPLRPDRINSYPERELYGTFYKLADDLAWMDDSLAALRVYELIRALDVLAIWPELDLEDIRVEARGRTGLYAKLAAAIDPRIRACHWPDGFTFSEFVKDRYYDSFDIKSLLLPDALNFFDLDEL